MLLRRRLGILAELRLTASEFARYPLQQQPRFAQLSSYPS